MSDRETSTATPHPAGIERRGRPEDGTAANGAAGTRRAVEPPDPRLTSIQPGGGIVIGLEQAWGRVRRCWLKTFRKSYVERMRGLRRGDFNPCPHEVLDPRDLKFHRNQGGWHWAPQDDPFAWRDYLRFARDGLAELLVGIVVCFGGAALATGLLLGTGATGAAAVFGWLVVVALLLCGAEIVWFFRCPRRAIPPDPGLVVSPADGKVTEVVRLDHEPFVDGPAVRISIFLSIFNVHANRAPLACRVIGQSYVPGKFLNAMRPESARENEQLALRLEETAFPHRPLIVRQITGAIARRIVCHAKPGDELARGELFGMIKLGSRTELVLPDEPGLEIAVRVGQTVQAGSTVLARFAERAAGSKGSGGAHGTGEDVAT